MTLRVETYDQLDAAARAVASNQSARFLGGGTLVMRAVNDGDQSFDTIIRANDPAFRTIQSHGDRITIGAGATMADILKNRDLAFLAPAARAVGGPAIRNMASVGGNLFARSPYGDFATALLVLDAEVNLVSGSSGSGPSGTGPGTGLQDFLAARDREPRALVASVTITRPRDQNAFRFVKVSRVKPKGVSVLSIAANLQQSGGRISNAMVAYGAMGPIPVRALAVERALQGATLNETGIAAALAAATDGINPATDPIASEWYRRAVAPVHLKRLLLGERT